MRPALRMLGARSAPTPCTISRGPSPRTCRSSRRANSSWDQCRDRQNPRPRNPPDPARTRRRGDRMNRRAVMAVLGTRWRRPSRDVGVSLPRSPCWRKSRKLPLSQPRSATKRNTERKSGPEVAGMRKTAPVRRSWGQLTGGLGKELDRRREAHRYSGEPLLGEVLAVEIGHAAVAADVELQDLEAALHEIGDVRTREIGKVHFLAIGAAAQLPHDRQALARLAGGVEVVGRSSRLSRYHGWRYSPSSVRIGAWRGRARRAQCRSAAHKKLASQSIATVPCPVAIHSSTVPGNESL